jgi:hypothetical protein
VVVAKSIEQKRRKEDPCHQWQANKEIDFLVEPDEG